MQPFRYISEMWGNYSRAWGVGPSWRAFRSLFGSDGGFFGQPLMKGTSVNYDMAREIYRNDGPDIFYGGGFARPIIDLSVEYIGLPSVTSDNGEVDTFLNDCIHRFWAADLSEMLRNSIRDSKSIIRYRQPDISNKLFTEEDRIHGRIQCLPPEEVDIVWSPSDPDMVDAASIHHEVDVDERTQDEINRGDPPRIKVHEIIETITPEQYSFFDKTDAKFLESWSIRNTWGFVPVWPVYNEYDSTLGGGQSDIEPVLPFLRAFHDLFLQSITAHAYHSIPKLKFTLKDITPFLKNNFPEVLDTDTGAVKAGSQIKLSSRDIFFVQSEENIDFVEATSVLGDSKTLMEFIIDCIAITAETPRWALLKESKVVSTDASVLPFEKKIERKRNMFAPVIQMLMKMALVTTGREPTTVRVTWPAISIENLASKGQAIQMLIMGLDVASAHGWIADETSVQILAELFPQMNAPNVEMALAKSNVVPEIPAPAPQSDTQGANSNGNGGGTKKAAKRAVATGKASNS